MNNIREVAKRAGVGIGTVSRVLNGHPSVRPEVRQRVLDVVKELDYVPNIHAQRMWKGRTNTLCFLLSNREMLLSLHGHIFRGVEQFCSINGYSVLFSSFKYSGHTASAKLELPPILRNRGIVDGVILGGVNYPNLVERMRAEGMPFSIFGNNMVDAAAIQGNAVLFDDSEGAEQAVEHLIRLGHRQIWFAGDVAWPWNQRRYDRFLSVMRRADLEPKAVTVGLARAGHELGMRAAKMILESEPCSAIFAASDYIACGVIETAQQMGRKVPEDLSVIGFDALDEFVYYRPAITSIGTDKEKVGEHCARLVIRQVESNDVSPQPNVSLPMNLIERDSCSPFGHTELEPRKRARKVLQEEQTR